MLQRLRVALWMASLLVPPCALAGGGPLGIDHEWARDDTGIWSRHIQTGLEDGAVALTVAGALWLGNDEPLGHTLWQSADALAVSSISAQLLKYAFSRARPTQGNDPNRWFQGHGYQSFPSGEVTVQAAFVMPFIVDYAHDHPWVWALELLPIYDGIARLKSQAHWQTDVLAGWALGSGVGYWAARRETPLFVQILPHGITVGIVKHF